MEGKWECESCCDRNSKCVEASEHVMQRFSSQEDLVRHIMHHHLSKKIEHGRTVFICTCGPSGICNKTNSLHSHLREPVSFDSEYDYERHLVTKHIISNTKSSAPPRFKRLSVLSPPKHAWMQYDSVVNMAAVLNDPSDRQLDIFSRYWGDAFEREPVPPLRIPAVNEEHFFSYLNLLAKRKVPINSQRTPKNPPSCQPNPLELEEAKVYCSPDFNLSSSKTFNSVIPLYRRGLCQNLIGVFTQQSDQLSQYLDAVELAIVNHVSERSPAFFEAVRAHDVIKDQLSQTISELNAVRTRLTEVDAIYCRGAGQVARLVRRRENLKILLAKLKVISSVHATQPTIQSLLKSNDFCSVLDLITNTRESLHAMNKSGNGDGDGRGGEIVCLRHLDAQLTEIAKFVNTMISTEFESALRSFLASPPNEAVDGGVFEVLIPSVLGLIRVGQTGFVSTIEKEVQKALNDALRSLHGLLQSGENGYAQESTSRNPSIDSTEKEPFHVWLSNLRTGCLAVEQVLLRLKTVVESIASAVTEYGEQLRCIYWKFAERSQREIAARINAYLRQSRVLNRPLPSSEDFVAFAELIEDFHERVVASAWHCYRPDLPLASQSTVLRNLVATEAVLLIQSFHEDRCKTLVQTLDKEKWGPAEKGLDPSLAGLLSHLIVHHELKKLDIEEKAHGVTDGTKLVFQNETYVVVETIFTVIPLLLDYLRLSEQLASWPSLLRDIKVNLAQFLTLLNSKSCELVIGGGACQSVGLKRIYARNVALVVRSLEYVLELVPIVQIFFERIQLKSLQGRRGSLNTATKRIEASRLLDPFTAVEHSIRLNISTVVDKLTNLLAARIARVMQSWKPQPPTPTAEMRLVFKTVSKLTESTGGILSPEMLTNLLLRVHVEFKASLRNRLTDLSLFPDGGPKQGLVNSELVIYMKFLCGLTPTLAQYTDECDDIWPSRTGAED
ncbi:Vacuolar protein sorting-associated protein 54 [Taenia crassiceps]|uniref:Vacuolar protein sorting-associated protein 54 n=1 Tax=Taenia crassiceps TaxID=6207 RepID=A0ABR4Q530_9CEST